MSLTITRDPAMLSYLLTDELYIVSDESPAVDGEHVQPLADHPEKKQAGNPSADQRENKQVLIVVDYPGSTLLPASELNYLNKILTSVGLKQEDVVILNHATAAHDFEKLKASFNCSGLLIFGLAPEKLNIPVPVSLYKTVRLDGVDILSSDRLDQLRPDVSKRKQLWTGLQKMFGGSV